MSVRGGTTAIGTVTLDDPAPGGGIAVAIVSHRSDARPASGVTVLTGDRTATFPIPTGSVSGDTEVVITVSYDGRSISTQMRITNASASIPGGGSSGSGGDVVATVQSPAAGPAASAFSLGPNLSPFALLGGSAVTCTTSTVTGDVGVSPGTAITGFPGSGCTASGSIRTTVDSAAAQADLVARYGDLSQACLSISGNLNGVTLQPGVYCVAAAATNLSSTLTLSGSGRHILRFESTLITSPGSRIAIDNGASCGGVAYQVGSSATIGGTLVGNIIALTAITLNPGSDVRGRALARNAAVTMTSSVISNSGC